MKKCSRILLLTSIMLLAGLTRKASAQNPYLGEIRMFAGNFAPQGWAKCEGQLLPISQNTALFSILGTTFGGNGTTNFALPDLRGRIPMGQGSGPGLTATVIGDQQGTETVTLTAGNIPPHIHLLQVYNGSGTLDSLTLGSSASYLSLIQNPDLSRSNAFTSNAPNTTLNPATITPGNAATAIPNKQPSLTLTFIIALQGIYPTQ